MADIVKTTVFLKHMNDFATMNEIYADRFPSPPREVDDTGRKAPKDALVEIDIVVLD